MRRRPAPLLTALALAAGFTIAPAGVAGATASSVTLKGAVSGTGSGGTPSCATSQTNAGGRTLTQYSVKLDGFSVGGTKLTLDVVFSSPTPGRYPLSMTSETFGDLRESSNTGDVWTAKTGSVTLSGDTKTARVKALFVPDPTTPTKGTEAVKATIVCS